MSKKVAQVQDDARQLLVAIDKFPALVEDYIKVTSTAPSAFGLKALGVGQGDFVRLKRNGRDFRLSTVKRVLGYIAGNSHVSLVD